MPVARFEKTLKLTPSAVTVAPSGALAPAPTAAERSDEPDTRHVRDSLLSGHGCMSGAAPNGAAGRDPQRRT